MNASATPLPICRRVLTIAAAAIAGKGGLNSWGIQTPCNPASSASRIARSNSWPGIDSRTVHKFLTIAMGIIAETREGHYHSE